MTLSYTLPPFTEGLPFKPCAACIQMLIIVSCTGRGHLTRKRFSRCITTN